MAITSKLTVKTLSRNKIVRRVFKGVPKTEMAFIMNSTWQFPSSCVFITIWNFVIGIPSKIVWNWIAMLSEGKVLTYRFLTRSISRQKSFSYIYFITITNCFLSLVYESKFLVWDKKKYSCLRASTFSYRNSNVWA